MIKSCPGYLVYRFENQFQENIYDFLDKFDLDTASKIFALIDFAYDEGFDKGRAVAREENGDFKLGYYEALKYIAALLNKEKDEYEDR